MLSLKPNVVAMTTGQAAVTLGNALPGWVSGALANAGAGATVNMVFNLGADWPQYGAIAIAVQGTQDVASVNAYTSDDGVANSSPLVLLTGAGVAAGTLSGAGVLTFAGFVSGRYLRIVCVNGATAQGAQAGARVTIQPT